VNKSSQLIIAILFVLSLNSQQNLVAEENSTSCVRKTLSDRLSHLHEAAMWWGEAAIAGPLRILSGIKPRRTLIAIDNVSVKDSILFPYARETVEGVARAIRECDDFAVKMGFVRPGPTDVYIGSRAFASPFPVLDLYSLSYRERLTVPLLEETNHRATTQIAHERFHQILETHYGPGAYTSHEADLQEALADIGASLFTQDPKGFRNIASERNPYDVIHLDKRFNRFDAHVSSQVYSRAFWKVRNILGDEEAGKLYKALVDDLNSCRRSYTYFTKERDVPDNVLSDFKYLCAIILRNTASSPQKEPIRSALKSSLEEFQIDINQVERISEALVTNPSETIKHRSSHMTQAYSFDAAGLLMLGAGGAWIHHHYSSDRK
jgi:hypothetical protein